MGNKYRARIKHIDTVVNLGTFITIAEAESAHLSAKKEILQKELNGKYSAPIKLGITRHIDYISTLLRTKR